MLQGLIDSCEGGNLALYLTREDIGRLRLTSKRLQACIDEAERFLAPFLPRCECPRQCDGRCVCPFGSLSDRALHFSRLTRSVGNVRLEDESESAQIGRCWEPTPLPHSPFGYGFRPNVENCVTVSTTVHNIPQGKYLMMARSSPSSFFDTPEGMWFFVIIEDQNEPWAEKKIFSDMAYRFRQRHEMASATQHRDQHGYVRTVWGTPILVESPGQVCHMGMRFKSDTEGIFDWLRLIYIPDNVAVESFLQDERVFFDCSRFDRVLLDGPFSEKPHMIHAPLRGEGRPKVTSDWFRYEVDQACTPHAPFWPTVSTRLDAPWIIMSLHTNRPRGGCRAEISAFESLTSTPAKDEESLHKVKSKKARKKLIIRPRGALLSICVPVEKGYRPLQFRVKRYNGTMRLIIDDVLLMDDKGACQLYLNVSSTLALTAMHITYGDPLDEEFTCEVHWRVYWNW